jgi:hypothetical protein
MLLSLSLSLSRISTLGSIFLLLWTFLVCCTLDCMPLGELVLCFSILEMSSFSYT